MAAVAYLLDAIAPHPQPDSTPGTQPAQRPGVGADGDSARTRPVGDLTDARWLPILDDQGRILALAPCRRSGNRPHSPVLNFLRIAAYAGCTHITLDPIDGSIGVGRRPRSEPRGSRTSRRAGHHVAAAGA